MTDAHPRALLDLLTQATDDPDVRAALEDDPAAVLRAAGLGDLGGADVRELVALAGDLVPLDVHRVALPMADRLAALELDVPDAPHQPAPPVDAAFGSGGDVLPPVLEVPDLDDGEVDRHDEVDDDPYAIVDGTPGAPDPDGAAAWLPPDVPDGFDDLDDDPGPV